MSYLASTNFNQLKSKMFLFTNLRKCLIFESNLKIIKRNFLSDNYYCYEKWDKYLMSDIMKKVGTVNSFSIELDSKLDSKQLVTPLDMELLAAKLVHINNYQELDFIENTFVNYRRTQSSLYTKESMHYSFVRSYIDLNQSSKLLQILKLKYKYGIFLSSYTANMLMDVFLKENDFKKATLVAHEVMLQEDNKNELTLVACLISCMKYLKDNKLEMDKPKEENASDSEEKKEKVLVYFLRKPYNDEHFDLDKVSLLTGKTIYFSSSNLKNADPILVNSLKVYGLLLFEKYEEALEILENQILKNQSKTHEFVVQELEKISEELLKDESKSKLNEKFLQNLNSLRTVLQSEKEKKIIKNEVIKELETYLEKVKTNQIEIDIKSQEDLFDKWQVDQKNELNEQIKNFVIELKKKSIMQQLNELERQEELLTYFEKRDKIFNLHNNKGFPVESPEQIPIEPDETHFKIKAERHFKPWPKYANKPESYYKISEEEQDNLDSLKKIYLTNKKTAENQEKS